MDHETPPPLKTRTLVAQGLGPAEPVTRAIVPPIHMSATYLRDADNGYSSGYVYGRTDNASVQQVEALIAALEGADEAMMFGSGMAAATAIFLSLDKPTHIVAPKVMYWGFRSWLKDIGRYGHSVTFVDTSDLQAVRDAVQPGKTGILWVETPSNPLWTITDIAAVSEIAHAAGALLCVDSTVSTPILTRPIAHGADIVVHSATKYLNGHSDVVAGALAVAGTNDLWTRIRQVRAQIGTTLGPFEAWLLMRGMKTLDLASASSPRRPRCSQAGLPIIRRFPRPLSGSQDASRPRHRDAADERRIWRDAFDPAQRRQAAAVKPRRTSRSGSGRPRSAASKA